MDFFSKLNVLTRLTIGFSTLLIVTTSVSVFSILKLKQINENSVFMLYAGDQMLGYKEQLSDALLAEISFEKKFAISREKQLYARFAEVSLTFSKSLGKAAVIADIAVAIVLTVEIGDFVEIVVGIHRQQHLGGNDLVTAFQYVGKEGDGGGKDNGKDLRDPEPYVAEETICQGLFFCRG